MNINASIVDQRVLALSEEYNDLLVEKGISVTDNDKKKSAAFVALCMSSVLQLEISEAFDLLTEGGGDAGVDGIYVEDVEDSEFAVSIFQGKYKKELEGNSNFSENAVKKMIDIVGALFDPEKEITVNRFLKVKMEEIRSYVRDGYIPTVRVVSCNNGLKWNDTAQEWIEQAKFGSQVSWQHINHDNIIAILQSKQPIDDSIILSGKAIIEEFNFRRVLVGKIPVLELKKLFDKNGDKLLDRNIRKYLGLRTNRVNASISDTLKSLERRENFYFFNNGITMICDKFAHNALQGANYQVQVKGMQIINGGQTCKTIQKTLEEQSLFDSEDALKGVTVMVRLYELPKEEQDFVRDITYATNSQNPVDLKDLRSNDDVQKRLEISIKEFGYEYRRQREKGVSGTKVITPAVAAGAVLAAWMGKPHQAKFRAIDHFGKLYDDIFQNLNGAQLVIAVLILRFVENLRKRPVMENPPEFLPYASFFVTMVVARQLLKDVDVNIDGITHQNYQSILETFENKKDAYYTSALEKTRKALKSLYGKQANEITLQRLSASFRRGDLLKELNEQE